MKKINEKKNAEKIQDNSGKWHYDIFVRVYSVGVVMFFVEFIYLSKTQSIFVPIFACEHTLGKKSCKNTLPTSCSPLPVAHFFTFFLCKQG